MGNMTDRQLQFIIWLITTATGKCQSIEEVRELNKEIRMYANNLNDKSHHSIVTEPIL